MLAVCNNDGVKNNGETGVDCGGGGCTACGMFCICVTKYVLWYYSLGAVLFTYGKKNNIKKLIII